MGKKILNDPDKSTLKLIARSPDCGDGWLNVAPKVWKAFIEPFAAKELLEIDDQN